MRRFASWTALLALSLVVLPAWATQDKAEQEPAAPAPQEPSEQPLEEVWTLESFADLDAAAAAQKLDELNAEFEKRGQEYSRQMRQAKPEEREALRAQAPTPQKLLPLMQALAEKYPQSPAEFAALYWVASKTAGTPDFDTAFEKLLANHADNPKLAMLVMNLGRQRPSAAVEAKFQAVLGTPNASKELLGLTHYAQLSYWKTIARIKPMLDKPDDLAQLKGAFGEDGVEYLKQVQLLGEDELLAKLEQLSAQYGDVELRPGTKLGTLLDGEIFEIKFLSIGKTAPDIDGEDIDGTAFKLSDYRGKIVVVDFWGDW